MKTSTLILAVIVFAAILFSTDIVPTTTGLIERFANAIKDFEGWNPNSRSYRNNNPGNIKANNVTLGWPGVIGKDDSGFLVFDSYNSGWNGLVSFLRSAFNGNSTIYSPQDSILDFFSKYAPSSDNNNPLRYAGYVANQLGLTIDTPIGGLA